MAKAEQIFKMLQMKTSYVISSTCEEVGIAFLMKGTFMFWAELCIHTHSQPTFLKDHWLPTSLEYAASHYI